MKLADVVEVASSAWSLDTAGATVLARGPATVVRLPAAGAAVHVSRPGVSDDRATALQIARHRLRQKGVPTVDLLVTAEGESWTRWMDRVIEVERWVEHDGRMNTWPRLLRGAAVLADVHDAWSDLDLGPAAEACAWANWIAPGDVPAGVKVATSRLRRRGRAQLADDVQRLADLTADDTVLPTQVVHGDFWDDNIYIRGDEIVAVTDFDFLGRRPRVDDVALLLYFADEQPAFDGAGYRDESLRRSQLARLVHAYKRSSARPFSDQELRALVLALARQPLWQFAKWLAIDPDENRALRDSIGTAPAVARAIELVTSLDAWSEAFAMD